MDPPDSGRGSAGGFTPRSPLDDTGQLDRPLSTSPRTSTPRSQSLDARFSSSGSILRNTRELKKGFRQMAQAIKLTIKDGQESLQVRNELDKSLAELAKTNDELDDIKNTSLQLETEMSRMERKLEKTEEVVAAQKEELKRQDAEIRARRRADEERDGEIGALHLEIEELKSRQQALTEEKKSWLERQKDIEEANRFLRQTIQDCNAEAEELRQKLAEVNTIEIDSSVVNINPTEDANKSARDEERTRVLREELTSSKQRTEQLEKELKEMAERLEKDRNQYEMKLSQATLEINAAKMDRDSAKAEKVTETLRVRELEEKLLKQSRDVDRLEKDLRTMKAELDSKANVIEQLMAENERMKIVAKKDEVQDDQDEIGERCKELQEQLDSTRRRNGELENRLYEQRSTAEREKTELQRDREEREKKIEEMLEKIRQLEETRTNTDEMARLKAVNDQQAEKIEMLKKELHNQSAGLADENRDLQEQIAQLTQEKSEWIDEREKLATKIRTDANEIERLDKELDSQVDELNEERKKLSELNRQVAQLEHEKSGWVDEQERLLVELNSRKDELRSLNNQINEREDIVKEAENERANIEKKLAVMETEREELRQERITVEEIKNAEKEMRQELARIQMEISYMRNELENKDVEVEDMRKRMKGTQDENDLLISRSLAERSQIDDLKRQLIQRERNVAKKEKTLKELEDRIKEIGAEEKALSNCNIKISEQSSRIQELEAANRRMMTDIDFNTRELRTRAHSGDMNRLREEIHVKDAIVEDLKTQLRKASDKEKQLLSSVNKTDALKYELDSRDKIIKDSHERFKALELEKQQIETLMYEMNVEYEHLKQSFAFEEQRLHTHLQDLQSKNEALHARLVQCEDYPGRVVPPLSHETVQPTPKPVPPPRTPIVEDVPSMEEELLDVTAEELYADEDVEELDASIATASTSRHVDRREDSGRLVQGEDNNSQRSHLSRNQRQDALAPLLRILEEIPRSDGSVHGDICQIVYSLIEGYQHESTSEEVKILVDRCQMSLHALLEKQTRMHSEEIRKIRKQFDSEVEKMRQELALKNAELSTKNMTLARQDGRISVLEENLRARERELSRSKERNTLQEQYGEEIRQQLEEQEEDTNQLRQVINELQADSEDLRTRLEEAQRNLEVKKRRVICLQDDLERCTSDRSQEIRELRNLSTKVLNLEKDKEELVAQLDVQTHRRRYCQNTTNQILIHVVDMREAIERLDEKFKTVNIHDNESMQLFKNLRRTSDIAAEKPPDDEYNKNWWPRGVGVGDPKHKRTPSRVEQEDKENNGRPRSKTVNSARQIERI